MPDPPQQATSKQGRRTVVVAVLTFRRPEQIATLVPVLLSQIGTIHAEARLPFRLELLVVDNDPSGTGRGAFPDGIHGFRYVCEPHPGIAAARNRALAEATADDALIFIDDDEHPQPGWLAGLLRTWADTGAAAVAGPVVSHWDFPPDPWVLASGQFSRAHRSGLRTGEEVAEAASNNLLLDLAVLRRRGMVFDQRLGLSGGEDSLLTRAMTDAGERIVWCAEAVVIEQLAARRMTPRYVLRLSFSHGNTAARVELARATGVGEQRRRWCLMLRGTLRLLAGGGCWIGGWAVRSVGVRARGARTTLRGAGMLLGAMGYRFEEYKRPSASAVPRCR